MLYCPKCGMEYRDSFTTCSECNCDLTDKLEQAGNGIDLHYEEAYLLSAANNIEADMIEAILQTNDIPVLRKYKETGNYMMIYMGATIYGVDLYVPLPLLDKAREIVENSREASRDEAFPENVRAEDEIQEDPAEDEIQEDPSRNEIQEEFVENKKGENDEKDENSELSSQENKINRKRRLNSWIMLLLFSPGILLAIIALIIYIFD